METQNKETITVYSVFSGTFCEYLKTDFDLLDIGYIPLLKVPLNCNKCFGRGHMGRDKKTLTYDVCNCLRKNIDHDMIKNAQKLKIV